MKPSGMNDSGSSASQQAPADSPADLMIAIGKDGGGASQAPGAAPVMDPTQDCVPLSSLALPDATEQMQNPEVGDKVQFTKEGTISRIEGDEAYIDVETVNGQPVEGGDEDDTDPDNPAEDQAQADANSDPDQQGLQDLQDMANKTQLQ